MFAAGEVVEIKIEVEIVIVIRGLGAQAFCALANSIRGGLTHGFDHGKC